MPHMPWRGLPSWLVVLSLHPFDVVSLPDCWKSVYIVSVCLFQIQS